MNYYIFFIGLHVFSRGQLSHIFFVFVVQFIIALACIV